MKPVLFNLGAQPITSFGLLLILSIFISYFVIWRMLRIYDYDEEKASDLFWMTLIGGFVVSRVGYVLQHLDIFNSFLKMLLINRYPGFDFWSGVAGALGILVFLCRRMKVSLFQILDFATVGFFIALAINSIGCFLGGCAYGLPSDLPIATFQAGIIGNRFPIQIVLALIYLIAFSYLWRRSLRFHFSGQIFSLGVILFGLITFFSNFYLADIPIVISSLNLNQLIAATLLLAGLIIFYRQGKKSFGHDLRFALSVFYDSNKRKIAFNRLSKTLYNLRVDGKLTLQKLGKRITKLLHVKSNPTRF